MLELTIVMKKQDGLWYDRREDVKTMFLCHKLLVKQAEHLGIPYVFDTRIYKRGGVVTEVFESEKDKERDRPIASVQRNEALFELIENEIKGDGSHAYTNNIQWV